MKDITFLAIIVSIVRDIVLLVIIAAVLLAILPPGPREQVADFLVDLATQTGRIASQMIEAAV